MLTIRYHNKFKKDYKLAQKRGYNMDKLRAVIEMLQQEIPLPERYCDHDLSGNYEGCRECHIQPDWLLIYELEHNELELILTRTGTHSDLF